MSVYKIKYNIIENLYFYTTADMKIQVNVEIKVTF